MGDRAGRALKFGWKLPSRPWLRYKRAVQFALGMLFVPAVAGGQKEGVRVCAGGDVTLGTNLGPYAMVPADPDALLAPLRPLVRDADILLLNVEGAIGEGPAERKCGPKSTQCFAFRQPSATAGALRRLGFPAEVVGNLANNHARDAGEAGLIQTARHLAAARVHVTGADALPTVVATSTGDTVAFLGFSTSGGPDPRDLNGVRFAVRRAAARYPRVVVTMHMGAEGSGAQRTPNRTEMFLGSINRGNMVAFAHTAVDAGADLVIGHGPHVMRAMEWRGDALIVYSLGNLVTYGPFSFGEPKNRGGIACATLDDEGRVIDAVLRSTRQRKPGLVQRDWSGRAAVLVDSLGRLDFPESAARVRADGAVLRPLGEVGQR